MISAGFKETGPEGIELAPRSPVIELVHRFERLGRVVVPTAGSWNEAGDILARISRRDPRFRTKLELLRRYVRFDLEA